MSFRIVGLPAEPFVASLALRPGAQGPPRGSKRRRFRRYPCRVSLTGRRARRGGGAGPLRAPAADSPYRSSHAVYVRAGETTYDRVDQVPEQLRKRTLSVRGFDCDGMINRRRSGRRARAREPDSTGCSLIRAPPISTSIMPPRQLCGPGSERGGLKRSAARSAASRRARRPAAGRCRRRPRPRPRPAARPAGIGGEPVEQALAQLLLSQASAWWARRRARRPEASAVSRSAGWRPRSRALPGQ